MENPKDVTKARANSPDRRKTVKITEVRTYVLLSMITLICSQIWWLR
ncbi:MAG: hypothetical protein QXX59_09550 [Candidatus Bathyarchaeia archaeon]